MILFSIDFICFIPSIKQQAFCCDCTLFTQTPQMENKSRHCTRTVRGNLTCKLETVCELNFSVRCACNVLIFIPSETQIRETNRVRSMSGGTSNRHTAQTTTYLFIYLYMIYYMDLCTQSTVHRLQNRCVCVVFFHMAARNSISIVHKKLSYI